MLIQSFLALYGSFNIVLRSVIRTSDHINNTSRRAAVVTCSEDCSAVDKGLDRCMDA